MQCQTRPYSFKKLLTSNEQVSFGWGHVLALTKDGKLFGWGYSADGRLGKRTVMGASPLDSVANLSASLKLEEAEKLVAEAMDKENDMPIIWEPCLIDELKGVEVADIHSVYNNRNLVLCNMFRMSENKHIDCPTASIGLFV
ncbi:ultraviolet-B receptor UVR8 isoform X1 [Tanacetum coccineum]